MIAQSHGIRRPEQCTPDRTVPGQPYRSTPGRFTEATDGGWDLDGKNAESFRADLRYLKETYFNDPSYHRIDG